VLFRSEDALDAAIRLRSSPEPETTAVLSPAEAAQAAYAHVFLLDMTEGRFPSPGYAAGLLNDAERRAFNRLAGWPVFESAGQRFLRERMDFVQILLSAERVTLLAPQVDANGEPETRSPFLDECLRHLPPEVVERAPAALSRRREWTRRAVAWIADEPPALAHFPDPLRASLAAAGRKVRLERERAAFMLADTVRERTARASAVAGAVGVDWERRAGRPLPPTFSATLFDHYANCPFQFLARFLLGAEAWEPETPDLPPVAVGVAVHAALQTLYRRPPPLERWRATAADLIASRLAREMRHAPPAARALIAPTAERWAASVARLAERWAEETAAHPPRFFEIGFGRGREEDLIPELTIALDADPPIRLVGRIDRIDVGEGLVRVVDYKTTANRSPLTRQLKDGVFGVTHFQMPIYLSALAEAVRQGKFGASPRRMEAMFVAVGKPSFNPGDRKAFDLQDDELPAYFALDLPTRRLLAEESEANLANALAALVARLRAGDFQVTPHSCEYCPFGPVCRVRETTVRFEENRSA